MFVFKAAFEDGTDDVYRVFEKRGDADRLFSGTHKLVLQGELKDVSLFHVHYPCDVEEARDLVRSGNREHVDILDRYTGEVPTLSLKDLGLE